MQQVNCCLISNYGFLEKSLQIASKEVISKRYKLLQEPKIFGYNNTMKEEIRKRRVLCSLWKKEKNITRKSERENEYRIQREKVNEIIDKAEAEAVSKIIEKDGKEGINFWKTMKKIKKKPMNDDKIRKENGDITDDPTEVLAAKRSYFQKLYSKEMQTTEETEEENLIKKKMLQMFKVDNNSGINDRIEGKEIDASIERSKNGAPGPDEITNMMLKSSKDIIRPSLTEIVNGIKENEIEFPVSWELGDIISFFKGKGDPYDMMYQRGITLTSCVLKVLENVVGCRIEPVIRDNSTPLQGGGKKGESPEEYIFVLQTIIDKNKQDNKPTKLIITDVEKAFDLMSPGVRQGIYVFEI